MNEHPQHFAMQSAGVGLPYSPAKPMRSTSWWQRWKVERACKKRGGHWWHPDSGMIDWFCCQCGKETDGMPKDGQ